MNILKRLIAVAILVSVLGLSYGYCLAGPLPNFVAVNYGPFHKDGQASGTPIPDSQFLADLGVIAKKFTFIKTYGLDTASRLNRVAPLVSEHFPQMKVFLGVYEDGSNHAGVTKPQLDLAISQANAYPNTVKCVVVGNECLPTDNIRNPVQVAQLIADLQYVRNKIHNKNILVTTCLGYGSAQAHGNELKPYCDVMMVNIYPFYGEGKVDIANAWNNLANAYKAFAAQFSGKQVIVGETGWPSAGPASGVSIPSIANEKAFTSQVLANATKLGPIFLFEAFDEPWKHDNEWESHWGLWDKNGAPKFSLGTHLTRDTVWLEDQNGNGAEELALLQNELDKGQIRVILRDGSTTKAIRVMRFFSWGWTPVALIGLPDLNSNGAQELAVLAFNEQASAVRVIVKDSATGKVLSTIDFDSDFEARELMARGENHIAVLGVNPVNNMTQVEVRHAVSGALIDKIRLPNEHY